MTENRPLVCPWKYRLQLESLPSQEARNNIAAQLRIGVAGLLRANGIPVFFSSSRGKTKASIERKLSVRTNPELDQERPLHDIYGIRFIVKKSDKARAALLIKKTYQAPDQYPWKTKSIVNHGNSTDKLNTFSSNWYTPIHVYIPFMTESISDIAEVQLFSPMDLVRAKFTRRGYEKRQGRRVSSLI